MSFGRSSVDWENAHLRAELERREWEEQDRREREQREREDERRRQQEAREEALRTVSDWPDAFSKGWTLYSREAREEVRDNARFASEADYKPQHWFQDQVKQIERAQVIYREESARVEAEIATLRAGMLSAVADRLEQEFNGEQRCHLAEYLREDNPSALVDW